MLERLSAYRIPVQPPQPPTTREIRRAEHEARKRRKEQEDQFVQRIYRKETTVFTPTGMRWFSQAAFARLPSHPDVVPGNATNAPAAESDHASNTTPPTTPGSTEQHGTNDEEAQTYDEKSTDEELSTDDEITRTGEAEKRKRFAWNYWMTDTDDDEERPAKRRCRRLSNGDKVTKAHVILPGGYFKIEVDTLVEPKPRRRKRDDSELDEGVNESETLRRIAEGRLVRRRVEEVATAIASDWEVAIVEQFVEIAAKYAQHEQFGESTGNKSPIESTEEAHFTDIEEGPLVGGENSGSSSGNFRDQEDSGYFSAENGKDDGNESDDSAGPRFTAEEKGKMPAEGPRSKISPPSGPNEQRGQLRLRIQRFRQSVEQRSGEGQNACQRISQEDLRDGGSRHRGQGEDHQRRRGCGRKEAQAAKARSEESYPVGNRRMDRCKRNEVEDWPGWDEVAEGGCQTMEAQVQLRTSFRLESATVSDLLADHVACRFDEPCQIRDVSYQSVALFTLLIASLVYRHRVLVDKWVDSQEFRELEKSRLLGWQDDDHQAPLQLEEEGVCNPPTQELVKEEEFDSVSSRRATPPREQAAEQVS